MTGGPAASPSPSLHPTEHRGLRELCVRAQGLARHHARLSDRLGSGAAADALGRVATAGRRLGAGVEALAHPHGIELAPAARGLGAVVAMARNGLGDRFLERGQAVRVAATELDAVVTLLGYLVRTAERRADEGMATTCTGWLEEMTALSASVHEAAAGMGSDPDRAIEPVDISPPGRAAQRAASAFGALGEWLDHRLSGGSPGG